MSDTSNTTMLMKCSRNHPALLNRLKQWDESDWMIGLPVEETSTAWKDDVEDLQLPKQEFDIKSVRGYIICLVFRMLKAEASGEITRPIPSPESCTGMLTTLCCDWPFPQERLNWMEDVLSSEQVEEPEETTLDQAEFVWNEALYQARKAAQEFSKETHADY